MNYAELQVTTHFSFLRGVSSAEELFSAAAPLGIKALGVTDRNSLAGLVRAHEAAKVTGIRLIIGCRLDLQCGTSMLVYPTDRKAYGRLCRLLTVGKARAGKGACHLDWPDVEAWQEDLVAVLLPDGLGDRLPSELRRLRATFRDRAYCALTRLFLPDETARLRDHANALAFLRKTLARQGFAPCRVVKATPNGRRLSIAGLVLVRQMPGSAKGVMFITLEDESANANLIVWPTVFEQHRRAILGATMLGCWGRVQSADGVIHLIVDRVNDLSAQLKTVSNLEDGFPLTAGRGDDAKRGGSGLDSREPKPPIKPRDMYEPDLHIDSLKIRARNFR